MSGRSAPAKPWERKSAGQSGTSSATPLGPSTANDGAAKPWEQSTGSASTLGLSGVGRGRSRPWEGQASTSGYGMNSSYNTYGNSGYGGSSYGGYNSGYGTGMSYGMGSAYSRPAYGGGIGSYGGTYNSPVPRYGGYGYGVGSMGGGMAGYGGAFGGMGGCTNSYGAGGFGAGPYSQGIQYGPEGPPPQPPTAWQHMLHAIGGVVHFFGRISFLVDENAHAFHFFISALLQLLDRGGSLYGELARFVLRLLGYKEKPQPLALVPKGPVDNQLIPGTLRPQQQLPGMPLSNDNFDSLWRS